MKNIAVIGAGTMGNGIAHTFAQSGFKVNLIDISKESLQKGLDTISKNLDRMVAKEKITEADKISTLKNIKTYIDIPSGVKNASLIVEAATENENLKLKIFEQLDSNCDEDTILTQFLQQTLLQFLSPSSRLRSLILPELSECIL